MIQEDRALLAAVSVLLLAAACGEDPVEPGMVASLAIEPDSVSLTYGQTVQLSAVARDPNGQPLQGKNTTWVSLTPGVATVSATGLVTAAEWGRVEIRALVEGKAATAVILVGDTGPQDFSITDAQFTQGVQSANGSVPLILDGNPAVLNLLIRARQPASAPMQVVLRLFDGATRLIRSDTVTVAGTARGAPSYLAPSAQFLVPADVLDSAAQWEVARDPRGRIPDDSSGNDAFPRSGPALILALPVPAVKLRFVPMVLTAHSGATGAVTEQLLTEYLQTARSVLPLGVISPVIGSALTTGAFFGTPPSGGEAAFWQQVLSELDMARVASAAPEEHWYGVVRPPAGFTFTTFGGFGYIPGSGQSTGPHTRTAVGVQVGWFSRPTQARDLVAHELGHNFGRRHSPCGGPSGVDPDYPRADGTIGLPGHDVYAWAHGLAIFAPVISPQTGDVMGYCYPMWASEYTYRGILEFRQGVVAAAAPQRTLVIGGQVERGRRIRLRPAFVLTARPAVPEGGGPYRLEGLGRDGQRLFAYGFDPARLDHASDVRHFTFAIPIAQASDALLREIRVSGPEGEDRLGQLEPRRAAEAQPAPVAPLAVAARGGDGLVTVTCTAGAQGALVLDGPDGAILGMASGPTVRIVAPPASPLTVVCSGGVHSVRTAVVAP